jgi:hypothetical protein
LKEIKNGILLMGIYIIQLQWIFIKYKKLFPNNIIIAVDISEIGYNSGPGSYIKGINEILPFNWGNCTFISSYLSYLYVNL